MVRTILVVLALATLVSASYAGNMTSSLGANLGIASSNIVISPEPSMTPSPPHRLCGRDLWSDDHAYGHD